MEKSTQFSVMGTLIEVLKRLSGRERTGFFFQVFLRYLVGLLDLAGIAIFGLLALIATGGNPPQAMSSVLKFAGFNPTNSGTLLPLFAFVAMIAFLAKGALSIWLTAISSRSLASLEKSKIRQYSELVVRNPDNRHNSFSEPQVAHALTVGISAMFTRTLGYLGIAASEIIAVLSIILLLAVYSPLLTLFATAYFALVGFVLQNILGRRVEDESSKHAHAQVASGQLLRESLTLFPELSLSGNLWKHVRRFEAARVTAIDALARTMYLTSIPRYAVEASFMVGAFGLAIFEFTQLPFNQAVTGFSIFIASGSRIAPSLITFMNSVSGLRQALPEVQLTMYVLRGIRE
jgi:hypothetical protein